MRAVQVHLECVSAYTRSFSRYTWRLVTILQVYSERSAHVYLATSNLASHVYLDMPGGGRGRIRVYLEFAQVYLESCAVRTCTFFEHKGGQEERVPSIPGAPPCIFGTGTPPIHVYLENRWGGTGLFR